MSSTNPPHRGNAYQAAHGAKQKTCDDRPESRGWKLFGNNRTFSPIKNDNGQAQKSRIATPIHSDKYSMKPDLGKAIYASFDNTE